MGAFDPALQPLVEQSVEDLAHRLSIEAGSIEVLDARPVVWPDLGLGCPQPGMVYRQVQVDGVHIELRVGDRLYSYHGGGGKRPFLCENQAG